MLSRTAQTFARHSRSRLATAGKLKGFGRVGQAPALANQVRYLDLHEYQSKGLMSQYKIRVQKGEMANSTEEALTIANKLVAENAEELVVKAQIHAGGRGKGVFNTGYKSGVHILAGPSRAEDLAERASNMFGNSLITKQTPPDGQVCKKVLVHEGISFDRELYFAILMDRAHNGPVVVASLQGGMDIEEVAERDPNAIITVPVDIHEGITAKHTQQLADALGFKGDAHKDAQEQMSRLYDLFIGCDATQVEINPLVETTDGLIYCVDAKIGFDENASFRQKEVFAMRDTSMEDPREVAASEHDLNYIGLDGNIGCMVNGAGLAMATMDIIQLHGGSPANFLDVGGGANEQQVEEAFKILTADQQVKGLLVNIFGGIMKCDVIAQGIVNAAKKVGLEIPLVVRLEGTNVEKGVEILKDSGLPIITARDLDDAAIKAVNAIA
jgi:succinyl-CoA synthetase beta subunit